MAEFYMIYFKWCVVASIFMLLLTRNPQYLNSAIIFTMAYFLIRKLYIG